jgi:hypothetical protein
MVEHNASTVSGALWKSRREAVSQSRSYPCSRDDPAVKTLGPFEARWRQTQSRDWYSQSTFTLNAASLQYDCGEVED